MAMLSVRVRQMIQVMSQLHPTKPIPEGNVTAKAYDNAEHPNSSTSTEKSD